jgi:23S rRNA (guanosine2251-2'-O)-methyltransferase
VPGPRPWGQAIPAVPAAALPPEAVLADGEEIVAGRHPVEEAFVAGRPALRLLVTPGRRDALERLVLHATTLRIPVVELEGGSLTAVTGFDGHQGVALVVTTRPAAAMADILARAIERREPALVLALDSLEDPQNVGTLLRSAEAAGVHGVVFPTRRQAPLSPAAIKASAGATEHLHLAPVDDLPGTLADLHVRGLRIVGTDAEAALTYREADLRGPLVLVVGSEGRGLAPAIRRRCDLLVRIPMRGRIESLNAAVAGSVLVFEAAAQRGLPERSGGPARTPAVESAPVQPAEPQPAEPQPAEPRPAEPRPAHEPPDLDPGAGSPADAGRHPHDPGDSGEIERA